MQNIIIMDLEIWLDFKNTILSFFKDIGPLVIYALLTFIIGVFIIKIIRRLLKRILVKSQIELSLRTFIESLSAFILWGLLFVIVGSILGIKATSFLAIFGAAGIAIGLALQGSLSNFAGGVLILVFKPFKVGDLIKVKSNLGYVIKIDILYTRIKTFDGRIITMPNGNLANSDVDNRSMNTLRRVDLDLKFAFEIKTEAIRPIILEAMKKHPLIEKQPEPDVWLEELGESEIRVTARSWVKSEYYWPTYWEQLEAVKTALDEQGIETPIPRRIVYQGGNYTSKS